MAGGSESPVCIFKASQRRRTKQDHVRKTQMSWFQVSVDDYSPEGGRRFTCREQRDTCDIIRPHDSSVRRHRKTDVSEVTHFCFCTTTFHCHCTSWQSWNLLSRQFTDGSLTGSEGSIPNWTHLIWSEEELRVSDGSFSTNSTEKNEWMCSLRLKLDKRTESQRAHLFVCFSKLSVLFCCQ